MKIVHYSSHEISPLLLQINFKVNLYSLQIHIIVEGIYLVVLVLEVQSIIVLGHF